MTGYSRKYANRFLTGSRKFKVRKGRGATYTEQDKAMLIRIWREAGCPCTTYFRANIVEWLQEFRTCVAHVPDNIATHLLSISASTMDRLIKGVKREKPGSMQRNRRSGHPDIGNNCIIEKPRTVILRYGTYSHMFKSKRHFKFAKFQSRTNPFTPCGLKIPSAAKKPEDASFTF